MVRTALVMGAGRSGVAAARLLQSKGFDTTVWEQGSGTALRSILDSLVASGIQVQLQQETLPRCGFDMVVVSPGIPATHPQVLVAQETCREVISELELGYRYCRCRILAITGTNGKSTLTRLLEVMLGTAGFKAAAGGNIGVPLCALASQSEQLDWIVVEVSSFQLELVKSFRPTGAVFLNLQPDHLDRHGDMDQYFALKCRLFAQMQSTDCGVVLGTLLAAVQEHLCAAGQSARTAPHWVSFGAVTSPWRYDAQAHAVCGVWEGRRCRIPLRGTYFDNAVTGATASAAAALGMHCCGVSAAHAAAAFAVFQPLPHRMAPVATIAGVRYLDDSKATNMAAMCAALAMQTGPVHLIAGGQLKEKDVSWMKQVLKKHVVCAYLIGSSAVLLSEVWSDTIPVRVCGSLPVALDRILDSVQSGDVVLLSPGCASFDQFESYSERGQCFANLVASKKQRVRSAG